MTGVFLKVAGNRQIVIRALWVALLVGIILNLINEWHYFVSGQFSLISPLTVVLTFIVPYLVSSFSSVLSKISLQPGEVANISARVVCTSCGKGETRIIKGDWIPYCNHCGDKTRWKIATLLRDDQSLQKNREKSLSLFARYNPSPVIRINKNMEILDFNDAINPLFEEKIAAGSLITDYLPGINTGTIRETIRKGLIAHHIETLKNKKILFEIRGITALRVGHLYATDVTALTEAREKAASMALFADLNPEPVLRIGWDGKLIDANPAARETFPELNRERPLARIFPFLEKTNLEELIKNNLKVIRTETIKNRHYRFMLLGVSTRGFCQLYSSDITLRVENEKKIREQAENIQSSIRYASSIQKALMPSVNHLKTLFPKSFMLFMPRDIVSGDFFWVTEKDHRMILAVADGTGHGVPGAFMSVLGISFLTEICNNMSKISPELILEQLRRKVILALSGTQEESGLSDGMDIALAVFDPETLQLQFAGAHHSLWIYHGNEFTELKGDRMPAGRYVLEERPFTRREIQLSHGDMLYFFSDGYPDQMGGENMKKITRKRFRDLLNTIHNMPVSNQQKKLEDFLNHWKGDSPQIDDIIVLGIRA